MKFIFKTFLFLIAFSLTCPFLLSPNSAIAKIEKPNLSTPIPFVNFENATDKSVPWIGNYVVGIQKFSFVIAGMLAVIMIILAGIIWASAAGNAGQISKAKEMITGAIVGLLIVYGTALILSLINPKLLEHKGLTIKSSTKQETQDTAQIPSSLTSPQQSICTNKKITIPPQASFSFNTSCGKNFTSYNIDKIDDDTTLHITCLCQNE